MRRPWLGLGVIALMAAFAVAVLPQLPDRIPTHWNATGVADRWASKWPVALLAPVVGLAVWTLLWLLSRIDPRSATDGRPHGARWLVGTVFILFLGLLEALTLGRALGGSIDVARVLMAVVGVLLLALGTELPRVRPHAWLGIRTPWTLQSAEVWLETHRLAGRTFFAGGALTIAGTLAPEPARPYVAIVGIVVAGFVPTAYSYVLARWERARNRGSRESRAS